MDTIILIICSCILLAVIIISITILNSSHEQKEKAKKVSMEEIDTIINAALTGDDPSEYGYSDTR